MVLGLQYAIYPVDCNKSRLTAPMGSLAKPQELVPAQTPEYPVRGNYRPTNLP